MKPKLSNRKIFFRGCRPKMSYQYIPFLSDLSVLTIIRGYLAFFSFINLRKLIKRLIWSEEKTPAKFC